MVTLVWQHPGYILFCLGCCQTNLTKFIVIWFLKIYTFSVSEMDHTNTSCLIIGVLSHGGQFDQILAKDQVYTINGDILFPMLRNPTLEHTTKFMFVQACKGKFFAIDGGGDMIFLTWNNSKIKF